MGARSGSVMGDETRAVSTVPLDRYRQNELPEMPDGQTALDRTNSGGPMLLVLQLGASRAEDPRCEWMTARQMAQALQGDATDPLIVLAARPDGDHPPVSPGQCSSAVTMEQSGAQRLLTMVRAVLSQPTATVAAPPQPLAIGNVAIDQSRRTVTVSGKPVDLTATEFDLLLTLARQPGRVFTRQELLEAVHGRPYKGCQRTLDGHIKNLRHKLEPDPQQLQYSETVYGVGYRFSGL